MASPSQFIGSKISLISKSEIRYEGILYSLDLIEATISLAKVKSFGTEDRPTERPVPAKDEVYEFIIFRGTDIKGIDVVEPPKTTTTMSGGLTNDPAIVEHSAPAQQPSAPAAPIPGQSSAFQQRYSGASVFGGPKGQVQPQQSFFDGLLGTRRQSPSADAGVQVGQSSGNQGNQRGGQQHRGNNNYRGQQQQQQQQQQRGGQQRGGYRGGYRGNYRGQNRAQGQPGQPAQAKVTFDQEFDFEKANEELLDALVKIKIKDEEIAAKEDDVEEPAENPTIFYQKDNFFDNISCEALEAGKGRRPDWRAERKLNAETFGITQRGGQGRGGWRGGYGGYRRGYQQQSYGGYNYNRGYQRRGGYGGGGGGGGGQRQQQERQEQQF